VSPLLPNLIAFSTKIDRFTHFESFNALAQILLELTKQFSMKKSKLENPNDHKRKTPATKGHEGNDKKFTSYDTQNDQTSTPQKVRENRESPSEQKTKQKSD
jgi:hypothetical protein